jgi:hypothetical protein
MAASFEESYPGKFSYAGDQQSILKEGALG